MPRLPSEDDIKGGQRIITGGGGGINYNIPRPYDRPADTSRAKGLAFLGETMSRLGDKIGMQVARDEERADTLKAEDAFNTLRTSQFELSRGPDGFHAKQGANALGQDFSQEWTTKFNERAKAVEESLVNDQQREKFRARVGFARAQYAGDLATHVAAQREVFEGAVYKATVDTEIRNVGATPADEDAVGVSWVRVMAAVDEEGRRLGKAPAVIAADKAATADRLWVARLDAWRLQDPEGALGAFQQNQQSISPGVRVKVAESLFADAAPILASRIMQAPLQALAATEDEARAIVETAGAMNLKASVTVDPERAAKEGTIFDRLPGDQKLKVLHLAKTEANQRTAQLRAGLDSRMQDAVAALERGLPAPNAPTPDELAVAYGPEVGAQRARQIAGARAFGEDFTRVASMSRAEQDALLRRRPDSTQPGFADAQRRHDQMAAVIDRVRREQDQDPAAYVLQQSPARAKSIRGLGTTADVRSAYELFIGVLGDQKATPDERAQAAQAYAELTMAEQKRLGIANPQILPKAMVDSIERRFAAPPAAGQTMPSVMSGMVEQWGRFWPAVGKQLNGKIPPEATVIGLGVSAEAEQLLAQASLMKPEQLKQGIAEPDVKDLRERIRGNLEPLQRSLAWQGGGVQTYDNYADSAERIALMLMHKGMKPKDAAAKAVEGIAGFKYEFEDTWRVPKTALGGDRNLSTLRAGALGSQHDIGSENPVLGEKVALAVPRAPDGVRPEDAERMWRDTVRSNGFWVTSPGDGGLTLYVRSGLGAQPVLAANGQPVRRTWDELAAVGNSVRAATMADLPRRRP